MGIGPVAAAGHGHENWRIILFMSRAPVPLCDVHFEPMVSDQYPFEWPAIDGTTFAGIKVFARCSEQHCDRFYEPSFGYFSMHSGVVETKTVNHQPCVKRDCNGNKPSGFSLAITEAVTSREWYCFNCKTLYSVGYDGSAK